MFSSRDFRRLSRGSLVLWGGGLAITLAVAGIVGGALDLRLGNTPAVRIDAPSQ